MEGKEGRTEGRKERQNESINTGGKEEKKQEMLKKKEAGKKKTDG